MAEQQVTVDDSHGKGGDLVLFGSADAATEHLRDHLGMLLTPLETHLELAEALPDEGNQGASVALVARALLRQVGERLDVLHERLREAGVGVYVGAEGRAWEPGAVVAMAVKGVPGKVEAKGGSDA